CLRMFCPLKTVSNNALSRAANIDLTRITRPHRLPGASQPAARRCTAAAKLRAGFAELFDMLAALIGRMLDFGEVRRTLIEDRGTRRFRLGAAVGVITANQ